MIVLINFLYLVIIFFFLIAAFFICYHIVRYSLSKAEMFITLAIFLSVFVVLIFSNLNMFSSIRLDRIIGLLGN